MEKTINKIDECNREIIFIFNKEEVTPTVEKKLRELSAKADIKGFRKGKVPVSYLRQQFGKSVEFEAIEEYTNEQFGKIVKEEKINVVGNADLHDIKFTDTGYEVIVKCEVVAEFQLDDYRGITIEEPIHNVTEEETEKEIKKILLSSGTLEDADQVIDDEFVVSVDMSEIDSASGLPIIGGKKDSTKIYLGDENLLPELKASLRNCKVGDNFVFSPDAMGESRVNVVVNEIKQIIPAEFNDELAERLSQGQFTSAQDLRDDIGFRIQEEWNKRSRDAMQNQIISKLVEANKFEVPGKLVMNVAEAMLADFKKKYTNIDTKMLTPDLYKDNAEQTVRWDLIRGKIIETEKIEVEDHDIDNFLRDNGAKEDQPDYNSIKAKVQKNTNTMEHILTEKVLDLVMDYAITAEIPFDDYNARIQADQAAMYAQGFDGHDHDHDHHDHDGHDHDGHDHDHHDHDHHNHDHHDHDHDHDGHHHH